MKARISTQNTATCLEQNRTSDTLTFYWSIKSAAVLQSFKRSIELNHLAENDCQIFLTSSIPCIPWIWMNVFNLKKLSKKIAWQYQLIWIRWSGLNLFSKRDEDSRLILNLPFLKCSSFFVSKTSQFEWIMLVVTKCFGERLAHIFLPRFSWFREFLHLWKLPLPHYNFLKYLWVISPSCLRQKPKFLEQVHWCSSCWDVV